MHPLEQKLDALRKNLVNDEPTLAMFEDVELTMFKHKFVTAGTPGVEARMTHLLESWDEDHHYVQYLADRRLLKEEAEQVKSFNLITVDVDPVKAATDDDFWRLVVRCYKWPQPPNLAYQTRKGAHLVWWLDPPLDNANDFEQRRSLFVSQLQPLLTNTAYKADPACKDWTHFFRAPHVIRTDKQDDGTYTTTDLRDRPIWALHAEGLDVTEWELPPPPPRRISAGRPATVHDRWAAQVAQRWIGLQPGAMSGNWGHKQTIKVAIRLIKGFGLDEETAHRLLEEWSEAKCDPPWSERELRHKIKEAMKIVQKERTSE